MYSPPCYIVYVYMYTLVMVLAMQCVLSTMLYSVHCRHVHIVYVRFGNGSCLICCSLLNFQYTTLYSMCYAAGVSECIWWISSERVEAEDTGTQHGNCRVNFTSSRPFSDMMREGCWYFTGEGVELWGSSGCGRRSDFPRFTFYVGFV